VTRGCMLIRGIFDVLMGIWKEFVIYKGKGIRMELKNQCGEYGRGPRTRRALVRPYNTLLIILSVQHLSQMGFTLLDTVPGFLE
jgi:hypothetical protein